MQNDRRIRNIAGTGATGATLRRIEELEAEVEALRGILLPLVMIAREENYQLNQIAACIEDEEAAEEMRESDSRIMGQVDNMAEYLAEYLDIREEE